MKVVPRHSLLGNSVLLSFWIIGSFSFELRPRSIQWNHANPLPRPIPTVPIRRQRSKLHEASPSAVSERLGLSDRFDRWRFLQSLLDGETDADTVNEVVFLVLDGALKYPRPAYRESDETGSPEMTTQLQDKIKATLDDAIEGAIPLFNDPDCFPRPEAEDVLRHLESLLPDPQEDEDDFKSLWDLVIELHGREMVKINESNAASEWKAWCLTARVLLHFDFLTYGIVVAPLV